MGIFRRRARNAPTLPSTGHPGDDQLLALMARDVDLSAPRDWVHYLYFANEETARAAADEIKAGGWDLQTVEPSADGGPAWVVMAERHNAVTSPDAVRDARRFFESIAASYPGGDYDGWEASA